MQYKPNHALYVAYCAGVLGSVDVQDELYRSLEGVVGDDRCKGILPCAASMIPYLDEVDRIRIIKAFLVADGMHDNARSIAVSHIETVSGEEERSRLLELAGLGDEGWSESILDRKAIRDRVVSLDKSGSSTYIFPEQHKASMRIIPANSAIAWFEAFYNWDKWYEAGFNYVPVEPIQDMDFYHREQYGGRIEELATVVTTNLSGRSLADWMKYRTEFFYELDTLRDKIEGVLREMKINHGHLHDSNFVVVPYEASDGKVDYSRCPRLYVIDFDQAVKSPSLS